MKAVPDESCGKIILCMNLLLGAVVFELSNRVQNISGHNQSNTNARIFGKAQVDVNLSLGQIIRNAVFEEADIEYQPVAFFNTRIALRNAFQVNKIFIYILL